jgi:hypothetical protein
MLTLRACVNEFTVAGKPEVQVRSSMDADIHRDDPMS